MKTIKDLTPEIKSKITKYQKDCIDKLYKGEEAKEYDRKNTREYIEYLYTLAKQKDKPVVIVANSLTQYTHFYNILFNPDINKEMSKIVKTLWLAKNNKLKSKVSKIDILKELKIDNIDKKQLNKKPSYHYLFLASEYSRVYLMWYKFIKDEFNISTKKEKELDWLFNRVKESQISKCFFTKGVVLVLRLPVQIRRNNIGFHDVSNEGAIIYPNEKLYYINGRKMPSWVFDKYFSKKLTFEDFIKETNEDIKAGIIFLIREHEGGAGLLKFLNAELVDEANIVHDSGHIETLKLFKSKEKYSFLSDFNGKTNVPYTWFYEKCPSTGTEYLLDSSAHLKTAMEAAKFHRPKLIPTETPYNFKEFNN